MKITIPFLPVFFLVFLWLYPVNLRATDNLGNFEDGLDGTYSSDDSNSSGSQNDNEKDKAKKAKKEKKNKDKGKSKDKNDDQDSEEETGESEDEDQGSHSCFQILWETCDCSGMSFRIVTAPFWLPYRTLEDEYGLPHGFEPYPFRSTNVRLLDQGRSGFVCLTSGLRYYWGGATGIAGRVESAFHPRWAVDTECEYFENPDSANPLLFASTAVEFAFAQSPVWRFQTGLGAGLISGRKVRFGGRANYDVEWFARPVHSSLRTSVDFSSVNPMLESSLAFGAFLWRIECEASYKVRIAGTAILHGPGLSIRIWL